MFDLSAGYTRASALRAVAQRFAAAGFDTALVDARALVCAAAGCDRLALLGDPDVPLESSAAAALCDFALRRLAGEPVTRILGSRAFWTLDLIVTPDVLDPRPDSECLVEAALDQIGTRRDEKIRCLDLGTGTGALLLAVLAECPNATGLGIDISPAALAVASENSARNDLQLRANFEVGDWTDGVDEQFDVVLSNPPYIGSAEIAKLDVSVRQFDPHLALDGGGDGLCAYRRILSGMPTILSRGGFAALETGIHQGDDVAALAAQYGLVELGRRRDLGGIERVLLLSK